MKTCIHAAMLAALCASGAVLAQEQPETSARGVASMKAGIDRATGRLRAPTAEERDQLEQQAGKDRRETVRILRNAGIHQPETEAEAAATAQVHADGSVSMAVPMSLMNSLVAVRDEQGRLVIQHAGHENSERAPHDSATAETEAYPHE